VGGGSCIWLHEDLSDVLVGHERSLPVRLFSTVLSPTSIQLPSFSRVLTVIESQRREYGSTTDINRTSMKSPERSPPILQNSDASLS
jgi:hypothetical protein